MVELTEEQRKQIVDAAAESIRATAIKDATERLSHYIQDTVHSTINEEVTAVLISRCSSRPPCSPRTTWPQCFVTRW